MMHHCSPGNLSHRDFQKPQSGLFRGIEPCRKLVGVSVNLGEVWGKSWDDPCGLGPLAAHNHTASLEELPPFETYALIFILIFDNMFDLRNAYS